MGRHFKSSILFCAGAWLAVSCADTDTTPDNAPNLRTLSAAEQQVAGAVNDFAFEIFLQINRQHPDDNVFISPFSISTALSMTANGAVGETKDEMKAALALGHLSDEEMNTAYRDLQAFLTGLDKTVALQLANSNWYRDVYRIQPEFKDILLQYYEAEVNAADFSDLGTKDRINDWIEKKTNGKIKNILDQIPDDAVMYLINAIYFKADWQYRFEEAKTAKAAFYTPEGEIETDMMFSSGARLSYLYNEEFTLVDIPYGNGQFSTTVVMDNAGGMELDEVIATMSAADFSAYLADSDTATAHLYLPKFKMEFKKELKDVLKSMGVQKAFEGGDFPGLFEEDLPLAITRVMHQSFIEVNEKGSEAAAATVVEVSLLCACSSGQPRTFRINRPFAFFIREKHSNTILFAGKMLNPAAE